jgi:hypothetical protein
MMSLSLLPIAAAQSPLTTLFQAGSNQGNAGGGIYFDLTVAVTVTLQQIDVNVGSSTPPGRAATFEVWLGPSTWQGNVADAQLWVQVAQASVTTMPNGTPTPGVLQPPLPLGPGRYGVALRAVGFNWGYSGVPPAAAGYANAELQLAAGGAQNTFLSATAPLFAPRAFDGAIQYAPGGAPVHVASSEPYGSGCYLRCTSRYQLFANAQDFDLGGSALRLHLAGDHYEIAPTQAPWYPPAGAPLPELAGNDLSAARALPFAMPFPGNGAPGTANAIEISTNGFVSPAAGNGSGPSPTVTGLLGGAPRWSVFWKRLDPGAAGGVYFDVDPAGAAVYVTWLAVPDFGLGAGASTFQLALFAGGDVEYRYLAMSQSGGGSLPVLTGWSPGGFALDPGSSDLGAGPTATAPQDQRALGVRLSARPLLGHAFDVFTGGLPPTSLFGAAVLSFTQCDPGLDLGSYGMPGCRQYVGLDAVRSFVPGGNDAVAVTYSAPGEPSLAGLLFYAQSVAYVPGVNAIGLLWANGLRFQLGTL